MGATIDTKESRALVEMGMALHTYIWITFSDLLKALYNFSINIKNTRAVLRIGRRFPTHPAKFVIFQNPCRWGQSTRNIESCSHVEQGVEPCLDDDFMFCRRLWLFVWAA